MARKPRQLNRRELLVAAGVGLLLARVAFAQRRAAKPLRIVVYGGSGNIGSRIVTEALARGHEVTVVDRNPRAPLAPDPKLHIERGDAFDAADIGRHIARADVLV